MATKTDWQSALSTSYEQLNNYLVMHVPQLISAVFLILLGWVIAWVCSKLTFSSVRFFGRIWKKAAREVTSSKIAEIKLSHAIIISKSVFWVVMLFFVAAATSSLGLDFFSSWLNSLLSYLPQVLAAALIGLAGYLLGNVVAVMVESAAENAEFRHPSSIGSIAKYSVFFVALVVCIEQLGINIQFITTFIIVVVGVLLFGMALAFGIGSNSFVANIIAAKQAKKHFRINEYLKIAGCEGTLVDITSTMLLLETAEGRVAIPARVCMEETQGVRVVVEPTSKSKTGN